MQKGHPKVFNSVDVIFRETEMYYSKSDKTEAELRKGDHSQKIDKL